MSRFEASTKTRIDNKADMAKTSVCVCTVTAVPPSTGSLQHGQHFLALRCNDFFDGVQLGLGWCLCFANGWQ